ncbi:MAG: RES family NAD+ phosphorylase [Trueperaceae bacterium]
MLVYRLFDHTAPYAHSPHFNPLDGSGGLYSAMRWNERGTPMLYCSASPALAILELLANVDAANFAEKTLLTIRLPNKVTKKTITEKHLLQLWRDAKDGNMYKATQIFGTHWSKTATEFMLEVPSVVCPFEKNYLINPQHPDFGKIKEVSREIVKLDKRLRPEGAQ